MTQEKDVRTAKATAASVAAARLRRIERLKTALEAEGFFVALVPASEKE